MSEKDVLQEIPDMSEVDFDTRLKVLMGVSPKGEEITVSQESESSDKLEDNNNG